MIIRYPAIFMELEAKLTVKEWHWHPKI